MRGAALGLVITAALAAVFVSMRKGYAMQDAAWAGELEAGDQAFSIDATSAAQGETIYTDLGIPLYDTSEGAIMEPATTISDAGIDALKLREGFSPTPYPDHKGFSIGYGHLIQPGEDLTLITEEQGATLFMSDIAWAVDTVREAIRVPLSQNQFDALVSFCFNVGRSAFLRSTLVKRINAGDPEAVTEFARWVYAGGQRNPALISRREDEAAQFLA